MGVETRILDNDPLRGVVTYFHYDHATDETTIETKQDCQPITEHNTRLYNDADSRFGDGMLHRVASIPSIIAVELEKLGIMSAGGRILDDKKLRAWLNDRDNRMFRTRPGRL
jgi:hypothetical protein